MGFDKFVRRSVSETPVSLTEGTDYYYFGLAPVGYSLSFSSELTSGEYVISVRDDAGNKNIMADGSIAETFTVDLDSPVFIDSINLGKDDKGRSLDDRITNIARPEINFKAEQGLNISFLYSSGSEEPAPISPSFTVESLSGLNLSAEEKTIFDSLGLTSVGNYDPHPAAAVYTITQAHVDDNAGLGLTAGSYALWGNTADGWEVEPVNASETSNIKSIGSKASFSSASKTVFDGLSLTKVGDYDPSFIPVYNITSIHVSDNAGLGLTAGSYAFDQNASGQWQLEPVNATEAANIVSTGDRIELPELPNEIVGTTANLINLDATNKAAFDALGLTPVGTFDGSLPSSVYTIAENNTDLGLTADTSYALVRSATGSFTLEPVNITDPISSFLGGLTQVGVYDPYVAAPVFTISQSDVENNPGLGLAPGNYALGGNENDGYELEQVDISNPQNIVSLGKEGNGSYKVSLTSDLDDGQYTLVITDDAGNEVIGGEEHQFVIEKVVPVVSTLVLDNGLDTGFLDNDRRTTERKPDFSFESEEGLRVFITKSIEVDERYSGPNKVYSLNEDHFGTMGAGSYAILDTGSEYLLEKVILDESTETNTTDYKVTSQEDDSISLAKDNVGITNFLNNEKEKSFLVEKTSADGTDKVAPFLAGQASSDTSAGTYTPDGGSAIKVYQLTSEQLSSSQGEGFYIIETTDTDYIFKEVEPNQETQDISNDYKIKPNDTSIGTYAVNPNSNLEEGVDYTVSNEGKNYSVSFITEFPDEKQGFYHVSVEDDAGNVNVVPTASTEQSIWVDNVMPVLQSANIDETGKLIKLFFSEELDTIPDIADYSITLSSGNGLTNDINLTGAQIERSADLKSEITISLKFPLFKEDNYKLDFVAENLGNYKDTVGKVLIDPSPVTVENGSLVVRSAGLVADGYITGATVFHDLNENGLFDENQEEVSVKTADDGTFKGLHGDVYKPLVSLGGVDSSTGLNFQSKSADGTLSDIALYAKSNATVINPLTSLVFQMEKVSKANNNVDVLDVFYNSESQEFSLAVNLEPINTSSYRVELNFLKDGIPQNVVYLNQNTISESEFNSIVTERFNNTDDFNQISFKVSKLVESEEGALVASSESIFSQIFSSLEEAKDYTSESNIVTSAQATEKVAEVFGLTNLSDIYNYDPIANDKVEIQAVSTQIGNLLTAIPYLVDTLSSSVDVFEKIVQQIFIASDENRELDLGKQEDLELIFGIDNSPPAEGEPAPDLLKELANANKQIGDAVTIDAQIFSQLIARDEIISNRTIRELSSLDPDFQTTDDPEKFIGSLDDDIIFASAGDDLFGDGTADHAIREGDIFIGGEGRDAVFLAGQESDYIFMSESPGSDLYGTIEMSLDHTIHTGNLGDAEILIVQKASDPTGFIYLQTEIIRFTDDVSWLSFDEATGGLSGNISSDDIKGSVFNTDIINGGQGNDILAGFGGLGDSFDLINGGGGDDSIIVEGKNTEATGGEGKDVFNVLGLNGTLLIKDFSLADDKIDLRAFEKSEGVVLTFADILASSSTFTEGEISGLKIDLSSWVKDAATYTGSVVIEEASKNSDGAMELIDGTILISENFYIETLTE